MMEVKYSCPLGHKCEKRIDDETVERCAWYIEMQGEHPTTKEPLNTFRCSLAWMPILLVENAQTNRGQTAAIESLRNEQVSGQQQFLSLLQQAPAAKQLS